MAIAAQGLADPRPTGRVDRRHLRKVFARIGVIQIDSVNVLVRSQELPLFARLGPHPRKLLPDALEDGELFEYWAHMAAIVPSAQHPLLRWRMDDPHHWRAVERLGRDRPTFIDEVLERIEQSGPLTAADLEQRGRSEGTVVGLGRRQDRPRGTVRPGPGGCPPAAQRLRPPLRPARAGAAGRRARRADPDRGGGPVGAARHRRPSARRGDAGGSRRLPPPGHPGLPAARRRARRGRPAPPRRGRGVDPPGVRARRRHDAPPGLAVERCSAPSTHWCGSAIGTSACSTSTTASRSTRRRRSAIYGYYVLPFLLGDQLVGRVDLKADRAAGVLRVQGAFAEPGVPEDEVAAELAEELALMAGWLGLDVVASSERGELAAGLRRAGMAALEGPTDRFDGLSTLAPWPATSGWRHPSPPPPRTRRRPTSRTPRSRTIVETMEGDPTPSADRARSGCLAGSSPPTAVFWGGFLPAMVLQFFWGRLNGLFVLLAISVFLSLAIEPGVNRLARRGWRRGTATALILFGVHRRVPRVRRGDRRARRHPARRAARQLRGLHHRHRQHDQRHVRHEPQRAGGDRRLQRPQRRRPAVHPGPAATTPSACRSPPSGGCCSCCRWCCSPSTSSPTGRRCAGRSAAGSRRRARSGSSPRGSWPATRRAATCTRGPCWPCCRRSSTGSCSRPSAPPRPSPWPCGSASSASSCPSSAPTWPVCCRSC